MAGKIATVRAAPDEVRVRASQVHVEGNPDYVPPPVVNLQGVVKVGHRAEPDIVRRQTQMTVDALKVSIAEQTHTAPAGASAEATEASRASVVESVKRQLVEARNKPTPREVVVERETRSHEENVALIIEEMRQTMRSNAYSG